MMYRVARFLPPVMALLLAAVPAGADEPFPTTPPPLGAPKDLALPAMERFALPNGLQVTLIPFGTVPKVTMVLRVDAGRLDEPVRGLTDLAEALMNEGAGGRDAAELSRVTGDMGGSLGLSAGLSSFSASITALSEFAVPALGLLADQMLRPDLPVSELPRLKQDMLRSLVVSAQDPQTVAGRALVAAYYGSHPYGTSEPSAQDIEAITLDDITGWLAANIGARRASLYIAGQFDAQALRSAINAQFTGWTEGPPVTVRPPTPADSLSVTLIDRPGAPQSTILIAMPVSGPADPGRHALAVTDDLLGGSFSSRITRNLREDKGFAYSPRSSLSYRPGIGSWTMSADVTSANTADSLREILREVELLRTTPPEADEVQRMQNSIAGSWVLGAASRAGLIGGVSTYDFYGLPIEALSRYVSSIRSVTADDVTRQMQRFWDPQRMTIVIVGDEASVLPQLDALPDLKAALQAGRTANQAASPR